MKEFAQYHKLVHLHPSHILSCPGLYIGVGADVRRTLVNTVYPNQGSSKYRFHQSFLVPTWYDGREYVSVSIGTVVYMWYIFQLGTVYKIHVSARDPFIKIVEPLI